MTANTASAYIGFFIAAISYSNGVQGTFSFTDNSATNYLKFTGTSSVSSSFLSIEVGPDVTALSIVNAATDYTKANFLADRQIATNVASLELSFTENTMNVPSVTDAATYKLTIGLSCHKVEKTSGTVTPGSNITVQTESVTTNAFNSQKVIQAGYFIPSGAELGVLAPYDYTTFKLDSTKLNTTSTGAYDYTNGYHSAQVSGNTGAYAIITNETVSAYYVALVDKGLNVTYTVLVYNSSDTLLASGLYTDWKGSSTNVTKYLGAL